MYYKVITTPGREEVDVEAVLGEKIKLNTQDTAKIVVQRLRALVKSGKYPGLKKSQTLDFIVARDLEAGGKSPSGGAGGTSIRLTEEQRKRLARIVGKHMYETGESLSMGEAMVMIIEDNDFLRKEVKRLQEGDD